MIVILTTLAIWVALKLRAQLIRVDNPGKMSFCCWTHRHPPSSSVQQTNSNKIKQIKERDVQRTISLYQEINVCRLIILKRLGTEFSTLLDFFTLSS
jgi:hypothetical protein